MTPKDFAEGFYLERKFLVDLYFSRDSKSDVADLINSLNLDNELKERIRQILNGALRDAFYTILLGLDGAAQIGGRQESYTISDENNNELSGGEIEAFAYEYFHNNLFELDNKKADFIAIIKYKTSEEGGRKTPAVSGYRPGIQFPFEEMQTSGQQTFIERELVFPGDTVVAEIRIPSVDYFANRLTEGMKFEFMEGATIIGTGEIKHIVNKKLKKASS